LFSNDGAVVDGAVDGRWRHAEYGGSLPFFQRRRKLPTLLASKR
jgi:hypothetical protein